MSQASRPLRVFLAHSHGDQHYVRSLNQLLRIAGFAPWLDEDQLLAGQDWELEIEKAIESSDAIAIFLSERAVNSTGYLHKEMALALDAAQRQPEGALYRVPIRLDATKPPRQLRHLHWIDVRGVDRFMGNYKEDPCRAKTYREFDEFIIGESYLRLQRALLARIEQLGPPIAKGPSFGLGRYLIHGRRPNGGEYFGAAHLEIQDTVKVPSSPSLASLRREPAPGRLVGRLLVRTSPIPFVRHQHRLSSFPPYSLVFDQASVSPMLAQRGGARISRVVHSPRGASLALRSSVLELAGRHLMLSRLVERVAKVALLDLLERGYFPKELPTPFVTKSFASVVSSASGSLPGVLSLAGSTQRPRTLGPGQPATYSHARGGLFRRRLSIANPLHHFLLCHEIDRHWSDIARATSLSRLAATSPILSTAGPGRAIQGKFSLQQKPYLALRTRLNRRFILRTDITRFYHSVYTHAVPWALMTKRIAKGKRTFREFGNRLDYWIRMGQDGQTVGVPIGPDTSLIVAEVIMHQCDAELEVELKDLRGHRYIDDYELGFRQRTEAEEAFHILERTLARFELALNARKTEILELPVPLEPSWTGELRQFQFRSTSGGQASDLSRYFDRAFELYATHRDEHVLQYAVSRLGSLAVAPSVWKHFQSLLLLCASPEPASLPFILQEIIARTNAGAEPERDAIEEVVNTLIIDHAPLAHSGEVAWSLWACIALKLRVHAHAVDAVSKCDDSVVALLALHSERTGSSAKPFDKSIWARHMDQVGLYDAHWLLSYEANVKGWLPCVSKTDHVAADPAFRFLKSAGASFYDTSLVAPPVAGLPLPEPKPLTFSSLLPGIYDH